MRHDYSAHPDARHGYDTATGLPFLPVYRPANIFGVPADLLVGVAMQGNVAVGGPVTQVQEPTPGSSIPFRRGTSFRTAKLQSTAQHRAARLRSRCFRTRCRLPSLQSRMPSGRNRARPFSAYTTNRSK